MRIDKKNRNTKFQDAVKVEMGQITKYKVFHDHKTACYEGKKLMNAPRGYQQVRVHLVYDMKHYGCHKAKAVFRWTYNGSTH